MTSRSTVHPLQDRLLEAIAGGVRIHPLGQPLHAGIPCSPNHPGFRLALARRHGDRVRDDGGSAASELIVTGGHVGTHIDALAHVSQDGHLHGGIDAFAAQRDGRFATLGADELPSIVGRGVLLDVARLHGVERLAAATPIGPVELAAAAERADVRLESGDVVLVRTGWGQLWSDPEAFVGHSSGVPGVNEDGARWLADRRPAAVGSDTTAFEHIPPARGHALLPAHRVLLVEHGIPILEMLDLERLSEHSVAAFCFVCAPLPIVGGTGSPVNPLAVVAL